MDPHELQQDIQQALEDAEHSIGGANILGRTAASCVSRLHSLCHQLNDKGESQQLNVNLRGSGNLRQPVIDAHLEDANERLALIGEQSWINAAANKQLKINSLNTTQKSDTADKTISQAQEELAHLRKTLKVAQTRISGLVKQLEISSREATERSKQEAACNSFRKTLEESLSSKDAQIAEKDAEITKLKSQLGTGDAISGPVTTSECLLSDGSL